MSRPKKYKNVCKMPNIQYFKGNKDNDLNPIMLNIEEYEVIRLIDKEDLTQEECSIQMNVSRPTIQLLYANARKKIATFLTTGAPLKIEGGSYKLCNRRNTHCNHKNCKYRGECNK